MRDPALSPHLFRTDLLLGERALHAPQAGGVHRGPHPLEVDIPVPGGFPGCDGLVLRARNLGEHPVHCGLRLEHPGGAAHVTGGREPLAPGADAVLFFPRECFGLVGMLGGNAAWERPEALRLIFRRPKDAARPEELRVRVLEVRAVHRDMPTGPRLTEAGLEQALRPGWTCLERRRNWGAFRPGQGAGRIPPPSVHFFPKDTAARLLAGTAMGRRAGFPPRWDDCAGGLEWSHFLHRHHFLRPLVRRLGRGQARGAVAPAMVLDLLRGWIHAHPVPVGSDGGAGPAWETLSVAHRLREWLHAAARLWGRPECGPEFRRLWLRSLWEHARHLMDHRGHPGNWRLLEAASLALAGLLLPEFREAGGWAETGLARLEHEFHAQFPEDGLHREASPLYHALCAQACLEVRQTALALGRALPAPLEARLPSVFEALNALARPDFSWPSLNDSGGARGDHGALLRWAGETLGREDLLWTGTAGARGRASKQGTPEGRARTLPSAGISVFRTDFSHDAHSLLFRAAPARGGHAHGDALSLEYCAHGQPVVVDPGIAGYAPGAATLRARSAGAHSMPLVDGLGPEAILPSPVPTQPAACPGMIGAAGGAYVRGGVRVERLAALLENGAAVVRDRFGRASYGASDGADGHALCVRWQLSPGVRVEGREEADVVLRLRNGLRVRLAVIATNGSPELSPERGSVALGGRDVAAAVLACRLRGPLPVTLLTSLMPLPGEPPSLSDCSGLLGAEELEALARRSSGPPLGAPQGFRA